MRSMQWQLEILGTVSAFAYRRRETKKTQGNCQGLFADLSTQRHLFGPAHSMLDLWWTKWNWDRFGTATCITSKAPDSNLSKLTPVT